MRTTKVLLIESARTNGVSFATSLKRKYDVQIARSGKQGLAMGKQTPFDVIVLNAASMRTSGDRISAWLRAQFGELPIIHIRPEEVTDSEIVADVLLAPPFTSRKLINRVERFVPSVESESIEVGPFSLNVEQQTLTTPWSEKKLTPKLVELMMLFLQQPDATLERKHIMQRIWKTDYMGDTRTLDVHIRWLRQVVEPKPRKPVYITTVRGVGYRFQVPEDDPDVDAAGKLKEKGRSGQGSGKKHARAKSKANAGSSSKRKSKQKTSTRSPEESRTAKPASTSVTGVNGKMAQRDDGSGAEKPSSDTESAEKTKVDAGPKKES